MGLSKSDHSPIAFTVGERGREREGEGHYRVIYDRVSAIICKRGDTLRGGRGEIRCAAGTVDTGQRVLRGKWHGAAKNAKFHPYFQSLQTFQGFIE